MKKVYTDETNLIKAYFKGDEAALETLIKQYLKLVYSFVYGYVGDVSEAEDITQEVFVKVWKNLKKFDKNKNFKTWLFSIAKNTVIDFLRKKKAIPFSYFETVDGENLILNTLADESPSATDLFEQKNFNQLLNTAITKLSFEFRRVLFLRQEDLSFREMAKSLNEPLNTVKSRYRRAQIALKKLLTKVSV